MYVDGSSVEQFFQRITSTAVWQTREEFTAHSCLILKDHGSERES